MTVQEFNRQLEAISAEYRRGLPVKLAELDALWRALASGVADPDRLAELERGLHSLVGSAKTLGITAVGEAAAAAESFLEPYCLKGTIPGPAEQEQFERLLAVLKRSAPSQ